MQGFKAQGQVRPTALGSLLQAATYGATVPTIYGTTQSPLLAIWAANLRQGGTTKKFKQLKKGITGYVENIDFLIGHNPVMGVLRIMNNGTMLPLNFTMFTGNSGAGNTGIGIVIDPGGPPDPNFYAVIAVTWPWNYSFTIDDYGGQGLQTLAGNWEVPFWNELEQGPDPTSSSAWRNFPFCYRWDPSYGPEIIIDTQFGYGSNVNIYYAQLNPAKLHGLPPLSYLRMAFESQLGSGSEYADAGAPYDAQQIIYPQFAGCGSSDLDLGAAGVIPQLQPEVRGKWGIYPSGDGDFADMIEDIFKSGLAQAAFQSEATPTFTQMERGLSSYNLPGCIQRKVSQNDFGVGPIPYNLPTTAGNFLVVTVSQGRSITETMSISDTGGNTWTPLLPAAHGCQIWWAKAVGGPTTVSAGGPGAAQEQVMLEIAGVDTYDAAAADTSPVSVTTTNAPGFDAFALAIEISSTLGAPADPALPFWTTIYSPYNYQTGAHPGWGAQYQLILGRRLRSPTTLTFAPTGGRFVALLAFKASQPSNAPISLGDFMDLPSLDQVRLQCRAYGLWGSLSMTSQSPASDWLKSLYQAANAAPVFLGQKLYSYPYAEQSFAGNGAFYKTPTYYGPIADLNAANGDFVGSDGCPKCTTADRIGLPNVLQMQCMDRNSNYNPIVVSQPDPASIALYGERKADPIVNNAVQDPSIARSLLGIQVRRNQYGGDVWEFTASARRILLSPMDLITLTDDLQALAGVPVRITSYTEKENGSFDGVAEPFVYGMCSPIALPTTSPTINPNGQNTTAGDVNPPIIFEPTSELYPGATGDQIWIIVSSASANYGGAQVMISTDGGVSYNPAGDPLVGNSTTGFLTANWPAASSPDTTNDLSVDLSESNGSLQSFSTVVENNVEYPCYVQSVGGGLAVNGTPVVSDPAAIPIQKDGTAIAAIGTTEINTVAVADTTATDGFGYELMAYAVANLTGPNKYTLKATGAGNFLLRAVLNAPNGTGSGVSHTLGTRFALLPPGGAGILKMTMPLIYVGQTIYFKVLSFNAFGAALQSLADVPAYTYVPTGVPGTV